MNYLGAYHSNYQRPAAGICDAPCVSKGRMMLCADETASEHQLIAMVYGRMRNRSALLQRVSASENISNAQLVIALYRKWGSAYPRYIEGPIITCLMDTANDTMVLSRDRMGEQPIFYTSGPEGRIVFSDHPDSLLKTASAEPLINEEGLCELFGLGPARNPGKTPLRDIAMLEPGCILIGENGKTKIVRYFAIHCEQHFEDEQETILHTRKLLEEAVTPYAALKPPVMLSGGLDSTALAALFQQSNSELQTFSMDYRDNEFDFRPNAFRAERDSPYVELAVHFFNTRHRTFILEQAALADALETAVSARGFPGMADIDSSLLLFAREISPYSSNIVSGECGDEVFAGYPWFKNDALLGDDAFPWSGSIELRERILKQDVRKKLKLREYVRNSVKEAIEMSGIDGDANDCEVRLKRMQQICFRYFMANLQERAVRMCGHSELEVITPLCDERLAQYVFNVPREMKFMGGYEKGLFRAAVKDLLPKELLERKKSPYPKTCSPIYTEIVRGLTMAMLADREAPILEWIDEEQVRKIADSTLDPAATPWYGQLMAGPQMLAYLWQVNAWLRSRNITVIL